MDCGRQFGESLYRVEMCGGQSSNGLPMVSANGRRELCKMRIYGVVPQRKSVGDGDLKNLNKTVRFLIEPNARMVYYSTHQQDVETSRQIRP